MKNTKIFQYLVLGLFVFFLVVGAILFATYRSKDQSNASVQITLWGTLRGDIFDGFVANYFNGIGSKSSIKYTEIDSKNFDQVLVEALASGDGPDAIILPSDLIVRFNNKIYPIPFTTISELQFKQTYVQEAELYLTKAGIIALPFSIDPLVMYWNRDIFNNASLTKPPTYWSEIIAINPKITQKDLAQNLIRSTVALGEFRNVANAKNILVSLIMQAGSPIVSRDSVDERLVSALNKTLDFKKVPANVALEFYTNFSNPSRGEYSWNRSLSNSLDVFANGDLAIYFGLASEYGKIKNKNPNLNFDVTFLPQSQEPKAVYSTYGDMSGFAIMKTSKQPAATYSILSSLTSAQAFPYWTNYINIPSARRDILAQNEKSAAKTIFNKSAIMSRGWLDPDGTKTDAIFQEAVESYTTGRIGIDQAINIASSKLGDLLD